MNVEVTNFIPYIELVHEYAKARNTDMTTAAFDIVRNLREYRNLEHLRMTIAGGERYLKEDWGSDKHIERPAITRIY